MKLKLLVGVILALILAGCIFWFSRSSLGAELRKPEMSVSGLRAALVREIEQNAEAAYGEVKAWYVPEKFEQGHLVAHLFGEVLYDARGMAGIETCDTGFNFGCFHGFVTRVVALEGLEAVSRVVRVCDEFAAPEDEICRHGMGHGLLEYFGRDHLLAALETCAATGASDPLEGCMSGVFMEYNVTLAYKGESDFLAPARVPSDLEHPYAPCDELQSSVFAQACYHELPRWWNQVYAQDFSTFGAWCSNVADAANRAACHIGIAKTVPAAAHFDVAASEALCAQAAKGDAYATCIIRAAWSLQVNNRDPERAVALCAFAPSGRRGECPE